MKKIKIIICLIIIILVACIVILLAYKPKEKINIVINDVNAKQKLEVENIILLTRTYTGNANIEGLGDQLRKIANKYLPDVYTQTKDLTNEELESYFTNNKNDISSNLCIDGQDEFKKLIENIRMIDNINISSVEIDLSEYSETSQYANFKIYFNCANNQKIAMDTYLSMKESQSKLIKFIPIIEE